jgi:hypothetical protein
MAYNTANNDTRLYDMDMFKPGDKISCNRSIPSATGMSLSS